MKKMTALLCVAAILICSSCEGEKKPVETGISRISRDEEGRIDPIGETTRVTAGGNIVLTGTTPDPYKPVTTTAIPKDVDQYGETIPGVTTTPYSVDMTDATTSIDIFDEDYIPTDKDGNPQWDAPVTVEENKDPITRDNVQFATASQIAYWYHDKVFRGYIDDNGNMLSITGELLTLSDKSYEDVITDYKRTYGFSYLTLHIDDYYETYWFEPACVYSALYENGATYECYSAYSQDIYGFQMGIEAVDDIQEGTYDSSIVSKITNKYGDPLHVDMHNVIWQIIDEGSVTKYICYNIKSTQLFIKEAT